MLIDLWAWLIAFLKVCLNKILRKSSNADIILKLLP
jgi:hypothetical protein